MSRIIAVANQKGGVGKTTTAINLSACLAEKNKKVLTLDMDPQGNTTSGLGVDKNDLDNTIYELMLGECSVHECILKNADYFMENFFSNNIGSISAALVSYNYRAKYLSLGN